MPAQQLALFCVLMHFSAVLHEIFIAYMSDIEKSDLLIVLPAAKV